MLFNIKQSIVTDLILITHLIKKFKFLNLALLEISMAKK